MNFWWSVIIGPKIVQHSLNGTQAPQIESSSERPICVSDHCSPVHWPVCELLRVLVKSRETERNCTALWRIEWALEYIRIHVHLVGCKNCMESSCKQTRQDSNHHMTHMLASEQPSHVLFGQIEQQCIASLGRVGLPFSWYPSLWPTFIRPWWTILPPWVRKDKNQDEIYRRSDRCRVANGFLQIVVSSKPSKREWEEPTEFNWPSISER